MPFLAFLTVFLCLTEDCCCLQIAHNEGEGYGDYSPSAQAEFCAQAWPTNGVAGPNASCRVPSTSARNVPNFGNQFVTDDTSAGAAVVAYQTYFANRVATAIAGLARKVKTVSGGKAWVSAYYGYLLHSPGTVSWDGHAAVATLLAEPAVDAITSPILYDPAARASWGSLLGCGTENNQQPL